MEKQDIVFSNYKMFVAVKVVVCLFCIFCKVYAKPSVRELENKVILSRPVLQNQHTKPKFGALSQPVSRKVDDHTLRTTDQLSTSETLKKKSLTDVRSQYPSSKPHDQSTEYEWSHPAPPIDRSLDRNFWDYLWAYIAIGFAYSLWFWLILLIFVVPYISMWLTRKNELRGFYRARMAELANPLDAGARYQLGNLYLKHKRYRKALPMLEEAYQIQKKSDHLDPRLLEALGNTYLELGKHQQAREHYFESLKRDESGGMGEVFLQLGRAYQECKDNEQAREWLEKACEANRSLAESVFRLAVLNYYENKIELAQHQIREFLVDANQLPRLIRNRNRRWVRWMRLYPWSRFIL
jgi:Tfp pilus assembly protein PilF